MSRELPAGLASAIEKPVVRPFMAVRIETPDPVYVWTGVGIATFEDSEGIERQWIGTGGLGSIDSVGETTDGSATGIKVGLNNIPSEMAADLSEQAVKGVTFEVYVGTLNETLQAVVATKLLFKGRLDEYRIVDGGETLTVEVTGESRSIDQRRPTIKKFSNEYQQRQHSGDLFFQYVPQMTEISVLWAKSEAQGASLGGGGGGGGGGNYLTNPPTRAV